MSEATCRECGTPMREHEKFLGRYLNDYLHFQFVIDKHVPRGKRQSTDRIIEDWLTHVVPRCSPIARR